MKPVSRFTLEQHNGPYENWPTRTRIIDAGAPTRTRVPGYNLLHQFELPGGFLLITDYDCPFEEATSFLLLDADLEVVATRTLGAPYASFLLDRVQVLDDTSLLAVFYDNDAWKLTIRKPGLLFRRPRLHLARWAPGKGSA